MEGCLQSAVIFYQRASSIDFHCYISMVRVSYSAVSVFTAAARWAEVVMMSKNCIFIYLFICVCVCVCARHFYPNTIQMVRTTTMVTRKVSSRRSM